MLRLKKSFFIWKMYLNGFIAIKHKIAEFGAIWRKIKINYYISRLCWDKKNLFFIWKMYLKMALLRWKKNWGIWSNLTCRPRSSAGIFSALSSFVAETPTMFNTLHFSICVLLANVAGIWIKTNKSLSIERGYLRTTNHNNLFWR